MSPKRLCMFYVSNNSVTYIILVLDKVLVDIQYFQIIICLMDCEQFYVLKIGICFMLIASNNICVYTKWRLTFWL